MAAKPASSLLAATWPAIAPSWVAIVDSLALTPSKESRIRWCSAPRGREHADDVLEPAAADVGDVGLHVAGPRAGAGGAPDALLEAGLHPRQVQVDDHRGVLEVVPLARDGAEAEHRELAGLEGALEPPEGGLVDRAVGDVRLDAVALAQRARRAGAGS